MADYYAAALRKIHREYLDAIQALADLLGKEGYEKWVDENTFDGELRTPRHCQSPGRDRQAQRG